MARTSNITFGQVAAIADAMKAAGNRPTARAVRERIGSGSMGTIHKLLQQWTGKGTADDEEKETAELPAHIANALMDFIGTEIATACEPINDELQQAKEAADDIAQDNERLFKDIESLHIELDGLRQERAAAQAQLSATKQDLIEANRDRATLRDDVTQLRIDLDRAQRQLELLANYAPDLATAKTALAESDAKRIEAEKTAAILTERDAAAIRTINDTSERLKVTEGRMRTQEEELKQANNHYQACTARLEAAAREIESLRKPKPSPAQKAKQATAKKTTTKPTE